MGTQGVDKRTLFTIDEKIAVGDCLLAMESLKSTPDG